MRNSLRKLKRGRKAKQEKKGEERMRKKGRRGDFEVEVALTEEEKVEEEGRVVRVHSSRRRGRDKSRRSSLLSEISKEVMVRVAEEGNGDTGFTIFPELEKQKGPSHLLPRFACFALHPFFSKFKKPPSSALKPNANYMCGTVFGPEISICI